MHTRIRHITVLAILVCLFATSAHAAQMSVEPVYQEVFQGGNVTVNITVYPEGSEVYGASYTLYFNNTLLNATSLTQGPFLSQDGESTNVFVNTIDNTISKIVYSEARMGYPAGVTGSGVLASITFETIKSGTSALTLSYVMVMDSNNEEVMITVNSGTCVAGDITPEATYTDIPVEEANYMVESDPEIILLDVSARDEYDSEHIIDARWVQISNASAISELDVYRDWSIIVYSKNGVGSREACRVLIEHGFANVYNMVGGIAAWRVSFPVFSAPKPTATEPLAPSSSPTPTMTASSHPTQAPSSEDSKLPGFEVLFAITGMFAALILKRNNERRQTNINAHTFKPVIKLYYRFWRFNCSFGSMDNQ